MSTQLQKKSMLIIFGAIIFYVALAFFSDTKVLISSLRTIKLEFLLFTFITVILGLIIRSIRQHVLLSSVDIIIPMKKNLYLYFIGLSMLITPGGSGEVIKSYFLKKHGFNISKTLPVVLVERFHDFVGVISLIGATLLFYNNIIPKVLFIFGILIAVIIFFMARNKKILETIHKKTVNIKFLHKITHGLPESNESLFQLLSNQVTLKSWLLSFLAILTESFAVYLCFLSINIKLDYFLTSQIIYSSGLIGLLTLLPGGLGVTEGSTIALLVSKGILLPVASAAVLLTRLATLWFPTIIGFISVKYHKP